MGMINVLFAEATAAVGCSFCEAEIGEKCIHKRHELGTLHIQRWSTFIQQMGRKRLAEIYAATDPPPMPVRPRPITAPAVAMPSPLATEEKVVEPKAKRRITVKIKRGKAKKTGRKGGAR